MDKTTVSFKKSASNYGLILGGILAVTVALLYSMSLESLTKWWLGIVLFLISLAIGIVSVAKSKSILGGFISFKEAFTSYFITIVIGLGISVLTSILIFNVVDPGAADYLNEQIIEINRSMMERFGMPEAEIEKALERVEGKNNYSAGNQLFSYLIQIVIYSVFGLLVALIMKRKDPNAA